MASVISKLMTAEEFYDWSQLWENRDRKSVQRDYAQYGRDLKMSKQNAQTLVGIKQDQ